MALVRLTPTMTSAVSVGKLAYWIFPWSVHAATRRTENLERKEERKDGTNVAKHGEKITVLGWHFLVALAKDLSSRGMLCTRKNKTEKKERR